MEKLRQEAYRRMSAAQGYRMGLARRTGRNRARAPTTPIGDHVRKRSADDLEKRSSGPRARAPSRLIRDERHMQNRNPDPGEPYPRINTQLFGIVGRIRRTSPANRPWLAGMATRAVRLR